MSLIPKIIAFFLILISTESFASLHFNRTYYQTSLKILYWSQPIMVGNQVFTHNCFFENGYPRQNQVVSILFCSSLDGYNRYQVSIDTGVQINRRNFHKYSKIDVYESVSLQGFFYHQSFIQKHLLFLVHLKNHRLSEDIDCFFKELFFDREVFTVTCRLEGRGYVDIEEYSYKYSSVSGVVD